MAQASFKATLCDLAEAFWRRRMNPWNWLAQLVAALVLAVGLWTHGPAILVFGAVLLGGSMAPLPLPPIQQTGLAVVGMLAQRAIRREVTWRTRTAPRRRRFWLTVWAGYALALAAALWMREIAGVGLLLGGLYLARMVAEHRASGIDP